MRDDRSPIRRLAQDGLSTLLGRGPGRVLDLCCGTGAHAGVLARLGWTVVGVDESEDQLRVAREREAARYELLVAGDARALPFADGHFDAVAHEPGEEDVPSLLAVSGRR